jgi:hypothetical protein
MINKQLEHIIKEDLERLIENSVSEGKSIDYKIKYFLNSEKEKGEFLADISSFANTSGGDLIFGIKEEDGIAKGIDGISLSNIDSEKLKIESLIRDGIEPRIQPDIHVVSIDNTKIVLIIRIHKSWLSPHRVIFKGNSKTKDQFYARSSAGKYQLDTGQLRTAFGLSNSLVDKIKDFRTKRIASLVANDTPIPFNSDGKIVLHIIPLEAFSLKMQLNINQMEKILENLRPLLCNGYSYRINLEGFLKYDEETYIQLYRNGIIEAVKSLSVFSKKKYSSFLYEKELLNSLPMFLTVAARNKNPLGSI